MIFRTVCRMQRNNVTMPNLKRFCSIVIIFSILSFSAISLVPGTTYASQSTLDKIEEATENKNAAEEDLDNVTGSISNWKTQQNTLKGDLNELNENLTRISMNISELETAIKDKETEIADTEARLFEAQEVAASQYELMKRRIKFMYENGEQTVAELFFGAKNFSDLLNRVDYISQLEIYDRKKLDEYKATIELIKTIKAELEVEHSELNEYLAQMEQQQASVKTQVKKTSNKIANYSDQISDAEAEALALEAQIRKAEEDIVTLKAKYEEELRLSRLAQQSAIRDLSTVEFADGDLDLLAAIIYCEAGGEPYVGQVAVGAVVINRLLSSQFPDTIVGVIYAPNQFSPVASGRLAIAIAENKATQSCYKAAKDAMSGISPVGNCYFFRTPIEGLTGQQIGGHIFY